MDTVDKKTRSRIMATVGQKGTKPEVILRRELHRLGFRYLGNDKRLPGSPDLVFPKYRTVIFVHGCFWHRHGCKYSTMPKTRRKFWEKKFLANRKRDRRKVSKLRKSGWRVKVVWECRLRGDKRKIQTYISRLSKWLLNEKAPTLVLRSCAKKGGADMTKQREEKGQRKEN
jgi:DNA mismatch endonuclease (patch repair protein)